MRILHTVNQYYPEIGGSEEAVRQISERMVRLGHDVTVATGYSPKRKELRHNGVAIRQFRCSGNSVDGYGGNPEEYRAFLRKEGFDVILNYGTLVWSTDLTFEMMPHLSARRVLLPCCYYRLGDARYRAYFDGLPGAIAQYDAAIYFSVRNNDWTFAERHGLTNGVIIPNAADPSEFTAAERGNLRKRFGLTDEVIVLTVSNHGWVKNHRFFWDCVPGIKAAGGFPVMIGEAYAPAPLKWLKQCYPHCRSKGLIHSVPVLEHCSRQFVRDAYADADIFLFGSSFECSPLVMFEALASGTLFVTTECGNVRDMAEIACVVRDGAEATATIRDFISDRGRYRDRIERGRSLIGESLNWEKISRDYEALYQRILSSASGPP